MSKKVKEEPKALTLAEAQQIRFELMQLDLSYADKKFNTRELRLIVQKEIVALMDVLRAIEPQEKEIMTLIADYNAEASENDRKHNIGVKDYVLTKEEKADFEADLLVIKEKYKDVLDQYNEKNKSYLAFVDKTSTEYFLRKNVKESMLPVNITGKDMYILSRLMEF